MGGADKALSMLRGQTLLQRAIARARPQVDELLINANGDVNRFTRFGIPVIADYVEGFLGPLAGILTGLEWMKENRPQSNWLATFACDTPFFPHDLVVQLRTKATTDRALAAVAKSAGRQHGILAVWSAHIAETAQSVLIEQNLRKVDDFIVRLQHATVEFPTEPFDPFFNINTPSDLARAETMAVLR